MIRAVYRNNNNNNNLWLKEIIVMISFDCVCEEFGDL